eukprot:gene2718-1703_t
MYLIVSSFGMRLFCIVDFICTGFVQIATDVSVSFCFGFSREIDLHDWC